MDSRKLRDVLGRFATGVTIVTVPSGEDGHGMTANAFTSVSLDPPLVLVCVDRSADTHVLLLAARVFAVNVLPARRAEWSNRFSKSTSHELLGVESQIVASGAPVLKDCLAFLDCSLEAVHPAGDHDIVIGRVLSAETVAPEDEPLIFYGSRYHRLQSLGASLG